MARSPWPALTARVSKEGDLHIDGQDLSRTAGEYEWAYTIISTRCAGREADRQLRNLLDQHGIPFSFWSRIDE